MASTSKKITLVSSDGKLFELEEAVAIQSVTVKNLIEDDCASDAIPLPNVTGMTLSKVIEYCKKHVDDDQGNNSGDDLKDWDTQFLKLADQNTLFDLILAANYLNIKGLLGLTCQAAADIIKVKTPEEIRAIFHIKNDFTPEEEEIRKENQWAFE